MRPMPKKMKRVLIFAGLIFGFGLTQAQESTKNNFFGSWQSNTSWTDGSQSPITNVGSAGQNIVINGYITLGNSGSPTGTDITFENNHPTLSITIADTLVVFGDMTFGTDAMELRVPAGGLLIVFGNLSLNNKTDLSSSGNVIVIGQLSKSGSQGSITGSGNFYAGSYNGGANGAQTAIGNGPPDQSLGTGADLENNLPGVYDFINDPANVSLPVELTSFTGSVLGDQIMLSWSTASQLNFRHFEVEHSINARDWNVLSSIDGEGTTSDLKEYAYTHTTPQNGKNYYRLRLVDLDETFEYSDVVSETINMGNTLSISPNPTIGRNVRYALNFIPSESDQIVVYDLMGAVILENNVISFADELVLPGYLLRGTYLVRYKGQSVNLVQRLVLE